MVSGDESKPSNQGQGGENDMDFYSPNVIRENTASGMDN
jgi:hypothetical protein